MFEGIVAKHFLFLTWAFLSRFKFRKFYSDCQINHARSTKNGSSAKAPMHTKSSIAVFPPVWWKSEKGRKHQYHSEKHQSALTWRLIACGISPLLPHQCRDSARIPNSHVIYSVYICYAKIYMYSINIGRTFIHAIEAIMHSTLN